MTDIDNVKRQVRDRTVKAAASVGDRVGVAVGPHHFYSPVTNRRDLKGQDSWRRTFLPPGIDWDIEGQVRFFESIMTDSARMTDADRAALNDLGRVGSGFGFVEAEFLFAYLRVQQPKRIVEIGSGETTSIMWRALRDVESEITAIDPYSSLPDIIRSDVTVRQEPLQVVTDDIIADLSEGDLLFIDSSHSVKTGSEVHLIYLDLLPRLKPGVRVHIHDIYMPYVHHPGLLEEDMWDWQETALLVALLANSSKFEIDCALSGLAHERPDALRRNIPGYIERPTDSGGLFTNSDGHFPASLYMHSK